MSTKAILEPILEGIRSTHFFNGRLLSGEDLAREQVANRDARRRLGQAIGEGVAYGLEVDVAYGLSTVDAPVVKITKGAAVNRKGDVVTLTRDLELSLVGGGEAQPAASGVFKECEPPASAGFTVGEGAYVLVIGPIEGREGRAPVSGLGNVTSSCDARYTVEGVRFRLAGIPSIASERLDSPRFRNRLAHRCFGTETVAQFGVDPFGPGAAQYGTIDRLRDGGALTDCDVPLAVIFWTKARGIEFVDRWPVRRRVARQSVNQSWEWVIGDRRASETEAMFLQFQDHVDEIRLTDPNPAAIEARARFAFLPPAGLLPTRTSTQPRGFDPQVFFGAHDWSRAMEIDANQVRAICLEALVHEAIDLKSPDRIPVYKVFENSRQGGNARGFVLFTTPAMRCPRRHSTRVRTSPPPSNVRIVT